MFAILQVIVPSQNFIFNTDCPYDCAEESFECNFALIEIIATQVPENARKAALQVYKWDNEAGQTMQVYGYGTTGRAGQFPTVSVLLAVLHDISNSYFACETLLLVSVSQIIYFCVNIFQRCAPVTKCLTRIWT